MKDFIQKIGEHQLPLIHSQIKEEVKGYKVANRLVLRVTLKGGYN